MHLFHLGLKFIFFVFFWECHIFLEIFLASHLLSLQKVVLFFLPCSVLQDHVVFFFSLLLDWAEISVELVFSTDKLCRLPAPLFHWRHKHFFQCCPVSLCTAPSPVLRALKSIFHRAIRLKSNGICKNYNRQTLGFIKSFPAVYNP